MVRPRYPAAVQGKPKTRHGWILYWALYQDARTIGRRARQIRYARRKSLVVVAGLAGISEGRCRGRAACTDGGQPVPLDVLQRRVQQIREIR